MTFLDNQKSFKKNHQIAISPFIIYFKENETIDGCLY